MRKILSAAMLACMATSAQASDWWPVGVNGNKPARVVLFIDRETIAIDGVESQVWISIEFEKPQKGIQSIYTLYAFDCAKKRQKSLQVTGLSEEGKTYTLPPDEDWSYTRPDTGLSMIYKAVCFGDYKDGQPSTSGLSKHLMALKMLEVLDARPH